MSINKKVKLAALAFIVLSFYMYLNTDGQVSKVNPKYYLKVSSLVKQVGETMGDSVYNFHYYTEDGARPELSGLQFRNDNSVIDSRLKLTKLLTKSGFNETGKSYFTNKDGSEWIEIEIESIKGKSLIHLNHGYK